MLFDRKGLDKLSFDKHVKRVKTCRVPEETCRTDHSNGEVTFDTSFYISQRKTATEKLVLSC